MSEGKEGRQVVRKGREGDGIQVIYSIGSDGKQGSKYTSTSFLSQSPPSCLLRRPQEPQTSQKHVADDSSG